MVTLAASVFSARAAAASPRGGATHGVVTGKDFNFTPMPPPADVLGNPLVIPELPTHKRPKETTASRVSRFFAQFNLGRHSEVTRLRWKVQDTIAELLSSVSLAATATDGATRKAQGKRAIPKAIRHPYHLRQVFDLLPHLPAELGTERRFLELLASRVLRKYGEQISLARGSAFSFEHEANDFFMSAFRLERQIKKITSQDERLTALQIIYNNYYHGKYYYYAGLLRRERMNPDNRLFLFFSRACYFIARIDWSGQLLDKPLARALPSRGEMMFYVQRDKTVLARYRTEPEFQRQMKSVLNAFPRREG